MHKKNLIGGAVAALLLHATAASASSGTTLEVEGIEGAAPGRQTIEVQSFSWGVHNAGAATSSSARPGGKVSVQDLSVAAASSDQSSAQATGRRAAPAAAATDAPVARDVTVAVPAAAGRAMCASGKHIAKATLTANGQRVDLENAVVTACTTQGDVSRVSIRGYTRTGHVTLMK